VWQPGKLLCLHLLLTYLLVCSGCSELVATCSAQDIRLWNARKGQELLRITVPNMVCNAVVIMRDGRSIVSGTTPRSCSVAVVT